MVRAAFNLLRRFLLTLALIVAAMPVKASAFDCAPTRPICAMPCCAGKSAKMACAVPEGIAKIVCPCDLRPGPAVAPVPAKAALPTFESPAAVCGSIVAPQRASAATSAEPGLLGADSGPPPKPPHRSDASRAPPVVRA